MIKCKRIPSFPPLFAKNTCTLGLLHTTATSQDSSVLVKVVIPVIMKSLLWNPKGLVNLPLWKPSLTRPFSLYHANQGPWNSLEERRLYERTAYKRNEERSEKSGANDFYWPNSRYSNDPTWRAHRREYQRAYQASKYKDDDAKMRAKLKNWLIRLPWVREELPWQSYRPVVYDELTEHYCVGCKWTRPGGRRLHWQNVVDTTEYL